MNKSIYEVLCELRQNARVVNNELTKSLYGTIIGDIQLITSRDNTAITDEVCTKVIKKMIKSCKVMVEHGDTKASQELSLCESLLPKELSEAEIIGIMYAHDEMHDEWFINCDNPIRNTGKIVKWFNESGIVVSGGSVSNAIKTIVGVKKLIKLKVG
jgi:hypothetical protein